MFRFAALSSLGPLLTGCATPSPPPAAPVVSPAPGITQADVLAAQHDAYIQGFVAGRRYQRRHEASAVAAVPPSAPTVAAAPPSAPTPVSLPPPAPAKPAPPSTSPPAPAPAVASAPPPLPSPPQVLPTYTPSGPAQPLSP